ncbi:MAG: PIN domain-containing protein [Anaerolineae bacterium]|nr:PIN domain-containing protein [Anaerolineae bacterium]
MNIELIARLVGLILFALGGLAFGDQIVMWFPSLFTWLSWIRIATSVVFAGIGFAVAPWLSIHPFHRLRDLIQQLPAQTLGSAIVGLFVGLAFGTLTAYPLSQLPAPFGEILPFAVAVLFGYLGIMVMTVRADLIEALRKRISFRGSDQEKQENSRLASPILLDTSVIIDGRIDDICRTGFIQGELIVPLFVLNELQHIADSSEALRRNRGRRGLEILRHLQEESPVPIRITDEEAENVDEVDDKLIVVAKRLGGSILTNDYNLNRVSELQGIQVLNVNELANAVKTVLLPGETFTIHVLQEGKELNQGVGYLDDGTMVVVEEGRRYIGQTIAVVVNKVLQTAAGRMIFAQPVENER